MPHYTEVETRQVGSGYAAPRQRAAAGTHICAGRRAGIGKPTARGPLADAARFGRRTRRVHSANAMLSKTVRCVRANRSKDRTRRRCTSSPIPHLTSVGRRRSAPLGGLLTCCPAIRRRSPLAKNGDRVGACCAAARRDGGGTCSSLGLAQYVGVSGTDGRRRIRADHQARRPTCRPIIRDGEPVRVILVDETTGERIGYGSRRQSCGCATASSDEGGARPPAPSDASTTTGIRAAGICALPPSRLSRSNRSLTRAPRILPPADTRHFADMLPIPWPAPTTWRAR